MPSSSSSVGIRLLWPGDAPALLSPTSQRDGHVREVDGHVATITYNRPDALNTINGDMRRGLNAAFDRFRDEEEAWVAIVTGAGRAFCAGADMRDGAGIDRRVRAARSGRSRPSTRSRAAGRSSSR